MVAPDIFLGGAGKKSRGEKTQNCCLEFFFLYARARQKNIWIFFSVVGEVLVGGSGRFGYFLVVVMVVRAGWENQN